MSQERIFAEFISCAICDYKAFAMHYFNQLEPGVSAFLCDDCLRKAVKEYWLKNGPKAKPEGE